MVNGVCFLPLKTRKAPEIKGFCVRVQNLTLRMRGAQHHFKRSENIIPHEAAQMNDVATSRK